MYQITTYVCLVVRGRLNKSFSILDKMNLYSDLDDAIPPLLTKVVYVYYLGAQVVCIVCVPLTSISLFNAIISMLAPDTHAP